jgi:hypothetical protein
MSEEIEAAERSFGGWRVVASAWLVAITFCVAVRDCRCFRLAS